MLASLNLALLKRVDLDLRVLLQERHETLSGFCAVEGGEAVGNELKLHHLFSKEASFSEAVQLWVRQLPIALQQLKQQPFQLHTQWQHLYLLVAETVLRVAYRKEISLICEPSQRFSKLQIVNLPHYVGFVNHQHFTQVVADVQIGIDFIVAVNFGIGEDLLELQ